MYADVLFFLSIKIYAMCFECNPISYQESWDCAIYLYDVIQPLWLSTCKTVI
jgi:hypothetical protein